MLAAEFEKTLVQPKDGKTLIVGSHIYPGREDRRKLYKKAVGVDLQAGPGVDIVHDMEIPPHWGFGSAFDHIECVSVLEHAKRPWLVAQNIEQLLVVGGTIYLSVPFVWRIHNYPGDYWRFTAEGIKLLFPRIDWRVLAYAHKELCKDIKIPAQWIDDQLYFARTGVYGFGVRQ
jgi:hypothetical protein